MRRPARIIAVLLVLVIFATYSTFRFKKPTHHYRDDPLSDDQYKLDADLKATPANRNLKDIHNSSLGFQKVFVINLPARSDKLDAFFLASSLSEFTADVIEGVHGRDVSNKTLPTTEGLVDDERLRDNQVGCWRAHLNFAREIVAQKLQSALVVEDDADWDVHLQDQLQLFAQGAQYIQNTPAGRRPLSPYGDDWDLLWLGHCGCEIMQNDDKRYAVENDATVPMPAHRINLHDKIPNMQAEGLSDHTRLVYEAGFGVCTYSYALSNRGAKRLLRNQAMLQAFVPIDFGLGKLCQDDSTFRCISVFPQIIDSHKTAGNMHKDSDVNVNRADESIEIRSKAFTPNIVYSMRLNIDRLLRGERIGQDWRQWPDDEGVIGPPTTRTLVRPT